MLYEKRGYELTCVKYDVDNKVSKEDTNMRLKLFVKLMVVVVLSTVTVSMALSAGFVSVDLKPYANSKIVKTNWWTGVAGVSDLEEALDIAKNGHDFELPDGSTVPFKIEDAVLTVYGTNSAAMPKRIDGIKIGMGAKSIYFLHMTGWENVGAPSYKFIMHYDDGTTAELALESNVSSDNWDQVPGAVPAQMQDKNSAWVWRETAVTVANGGLISTRWDNPKAAKTIKTIDFVSLETVAVPALFAITLGGASASVASDGKLATTWSYLKVDR